MVALLCTLENVNPNLDCVKLWCTTTSDIPQSSCICNVTMLVALYECGCSIKTTWKINNETSVSATIGCWNGSSHRNIQGIWAISFFKLYDRVKKHETFSTHLLKKLAQHG